MRLSKRCREPRIAMPCRVKSLMTWGKREGDAKSNVRDLPQRVDSMTIDVDSVAGSARSHSTSSAPDIKSLRTSSATAATIAVASLQQPQARARVRAPQVHSVLTIDYILDDWRAAQLLFLVAAMEYLCVQRGQGIRVHSNKKVFREFTDVRHVQTLSAHVGAIWRVAFSNTGAFMATGGDDCVVRVWENRRVPVEHSARPFVTSMLPPERLFELRAINANYRLRRVSLSLQVSMPTAAHGWIERRRRTQRRGCQTTPFQISRLGRSRSKSSGATKSAFWTSRGRTTSVCYQRAWT